jgi:pilus assembly protein CpaC
LGALDLAETNGLVTTLAEPNLTALSGETASFLAGGEFPIVTSSNNGTSVEYKSYGVSLAFTPTVLEGGRISMRVRPEVSQLTSQGAVRVGGIEIPALTTRRTETTVELGSGQSFMISGLLQNGGNNSVDRTPFLGSLPILGALFRSKSFRRNETELVVVVTPYLVRPVNAGEIALPTDGFRLTNPGRQVLLDQDERGRDGARRPGPTVAQPQGATPGIGGLSSAPARPAPAPAAQRRQAATRPEQATASAAAPGFSF